MATISEKIIPVDIETEMKSSYIDYAMSTIVARALPDVRDGFKPVHRRILFAMNELGLANNKPYKKSARIVGEVLGKYHPHGDGAVYDTMVRMAQDFSLRYMLVDGQGNFGSIDGDSPAAMRYTEVRLSKIAEEALKDIEKNTVDFAPNFDDTLQEPKILPTAIPNLLLNGSSGIAVGMATNIPPHNLGEIIDGLVAIIDNPEIGEEKILKYIKAPDFPTGGIIYGYQGVKDAYLTGRGKIKIRAKVNIETDKNEKQKIIVTELPYQVNKLTLIENIAGLVNAKKLEGISNINDESDRDGIRLVIDLKRDANANVVLNNLFKHTQFQVTFGVIMLALVDGRPKVLTLKETLHHFVNYRNEIVVRRTKFDLDEAEKRAHILEGFIIALDNIDDIIALIKKSKDVETAREGLMKQFKLSEIQAKAILEMRLQRLTGLERKKIQDEYKEVIKLIEYLKQILANKQLQLQIIKEEFFEIKKKYSDERRTEITLDTTEFKIEDLIAEENVVVTISFNGFIKRFPVSGYRRQARGGKGITGAKTKEDDFVEKMFIASTHDYLLFFTNKGRCYWLKVFEIPEAGRITRGKAIVNLLQIQNDEKITAILNVKEFNDKEFVMMISKNGIIKKTTLDGFSNPRINGIIAMNIDEDDEMVDAKLTDGNNNVIIGTKDGVAIRFNEKEVRQMGRTAAGVRAIKLEKNDYVVGAVTTKRTSTTILVASEFGYGKRTELEDYRTSHRSGKGVYTLKTNEKIGNMVAIKEAFDTDDIVVVTANGMVIRQSASSIRVIGRNTQGVKLIRLDEDDRITSLAIVPSEEIEEEKID